MRVVLILGHLFSKSTVRLLSCILCNKMKRLSSSIRQKDITLHSFITTLKKSFLRNFVAAKSYCHPNPCLHGGSCVDDKDGYACRCIGSYRGTNCEGLGVIFVLILSVHKLQLKFEIWTPQSNKPGALQKYPYH